jgi:hypothetical protein
VIEPFMVVTDSTPPTDITTLVEFDVPQAGNLPKTGDPVAAIIRFLMVVLLGFAFVLLLRGRLRSFPPHRQE